MIDLRYRAFFALILSLAVTLRVAPAQGQAPTPIPPGEFGGDGSETDGASNGQVRHVTSTPAVSVPEEPADETLANVLLVGVSALSLGLAPLSIALLNDDLTLGQAAQVSLVGTLGVLCASAGAVLFVVGGFVLLASPIAAILGEDNAAAFALFGALALGVGVGLVLLAPIVFSAAAYVDGGFGDSLGEIAVVSTVSTLTAGLATLGSFVLFAPLHANDWLEGIAIVSISILAANLAYGVTRTLMLDEPMPVTMMLTPPIPW